MRCKVAVALHRPYWVPADPLYLPVQAGAALNPPIGAARDDEGEEISRRNPYFCELTVHYWLWKNVSADAYGLCHYRRYLGGGHFGKKQRRLLTHAQAEKLLNSVPVLLPKKRHYWIETTYTQYAHAHHAQDLDQARRVIAERCPSYLPAFDRVMKRRSGHRFNLLLMRNEPFMAYSEWLFDLLFALEPRLDLSAYTPRDRRVFGYLAERLLDVWLERQGLPYRELPVVYLEKQRWGRKIAAFLLRKIGRRAPWDR